jgi:hypothetical protein
MKQQNASVWMQHSQFFIWFRKSNKYFSYTIFPVKKINIGKVFKIMRKLLFNYSFYSHPEIGNFRVWHRPPPLWWSPDSGAVSTHLLSVGEVHLESSLPPPQHNWLVPETPCDNPARENIGLSPKHSIRRLSDNKVSSCRKLSGQAQWNHLHSNKGSTICIKTHMNVSPEYIT